MNNKILFMLIEDEIKYLKNSNMDHREWYISLGYDVKNYDNIIRGFIIEDKIIFFKGINFNYDEEVITAAKKYAQDMKKHLNNMNLEVYCGIVINSYGAKWEPILKLKDDELISNVEEKNPKKIYNPKKTEDMIEFKNNYNDKKFVNKAIIISIITAILSIIVKIYLVYMKKYSFNKLADLFLCLAQVGLLGTTAYGYKNEKKYAKYLGLAASILLLLSLNPFDIILGILYLLFSLDEGYYKKAYKNIKNVITKKSSNNKNNY